MKEAAVAIIFFNQNILLIKRRDVPVWVLPGGGIEPNESPENACLREAKEETGIDATLVRKVGTWLPINRLGSCMHVFECKIDKATNNLSAQEESQEVCFFPITALPPTFFFLHRTLLETALKKVPQRIYFQTELTYWKACKTLLSHPILSLRYILSRMGLPLNN